MRDIHEERTACEWIDDCTVILFCALSKQVSAGHICETQLLEVATGTFHGDYKPIERDTIRPVGGYLSILICDPRDMEIRRSGT